ncbi:MAG: hypothetical protein HC871_03430 [Rhizobiales bacterium]|nr:hypothetical protein [Hyphomicrobiales bacterium]
MRPEAPSWPNEASDAAIAGDPAHRSPSTPVPAFAWLAEPAVIVGLIALYLLGHFVLRLTLSPTLGIDDAEQILFAQRWDFGYRFRQPPLFTWMLLPVVDLIGPGVMAVSLVRYVLLAITFVFYYLTARLCLRDQRLAGLAVLSLASIYVFAYYAHHDLTHTTALAAMIALALYVTARLARNPSWTGYGVAGLVCGLGMLAKWNFAMLAAGLPLACLLDRRLRPLVLTPRLLVTIAVMAAVLTPTALWMAAHGQSVGGLSSDILSHDGETERVALWLDAPAPAALGSAVPGAVPPDLSAPVRPEPPCGFAGARAGGSIGSGPAAVLLRQPDADHACPARAPDPAVRRRQLHGAVAASSPDEPADLPVRAGRARLRHQTPDRPLSGDHRHFGCCRRRSPAISLCRRRRRLRALQGVRSFRRASGRPARGRL